MRNKLLICFLIIANFTIAQNEKLIDSLKNELNNNALHDTTKINILFKLVENINDDNIWPEYNEKAYQLALKIAESNNETIRKFALKAQSDVFNNRGYLFKIQGNIKLAIENYLKALKITQSIKYSYGEASCSINLATLLSQQKQYNDALKYYFNSNKLAQEIRQQGILRIVASHIHRGER